MARNRYYSGPRSDHFDGERFFLPGAADMDKGLSELWRFWRTARAEWPKHVAVTPSLPPPRVAAPQLRVTVIGHASHLIQVDGCNLLVDPVWSERASPVSFAGPRRVSAPGVDFDDLPAIDAVLVTHNHYDHLDVATLGRLHERHACRLIAPLGNDAVVRRSLPALPVETYDWDERVALTADIAVTLLPCQHWSARGRSDRRMALWAAFLFETPSGTIYHVGDTGFGDGSLFRGVAQRFGPPRLAVLPIGAYHPRWFLQPQHMDPTEAVRAFVLTGAHYGLAHHWGCFRLSAEAFDDPPRQLAQALDAAGVDRIRFPALQPGAFFDVPVVP